MIIELNKEYSSCFKQPIINKIDTNIFIYKYYGDCFECDFCKDKCCNFGVDIDSFNAERLLISDLDINVPKDKWFTNIFKHDIDFPNNSFTRTQTINNKCVFKDNNRGCLIHKYCIENNIDFHILKPIVSCLFPITFNNGLLYPSEEFINNEFICSGNKKSLYQGVRNDLKYYFGNEFIEILDRIERDILI